ncbi:hypothetical protein J6590_102080 [Homalodisca vitripennis]|nr:hypothetical protein J6590_102080 [Homalodisca vitripennis]
MARCDPCCKTSDCVKTARDYDGEYYALCCRCARTHPYFWRFYGKLRIAYEDCEHNARPGGQGVFRCRLDPRHVVKYNNAPSSTRPEPLPECWGEGFSMNQCDPCLKICDCVEMARDWDREFYALCCKCARTHPYFWRFSGKRRLKYDECEHNGRPDGRSVFLCRHDPRHVVQYNNASRHEVRCPSKKSDNTPSSTRPEPLPECRGEDCGDFGHDHGRR